jgi:PPOX class probable F420-dependent enzyme
MKKLTPEAVEFLKGTHFAKLATSMKDGRPQLTPIWYMLEKGKLYVNTAKTRVKYKNIMRDPRICFLVDDGYPYVLIFGKGKIATDRDAKKDIESLAIRYQGEQKGRKSARDYYWKQERVTIEIVPDKILVSL